MLKLRLFKYKKINIILKEKLRLIIFIFRNGAKMSLAVTQGKYESTISVHH